MTTVFKNFCAVLALLIAGSAIAAGYDCQGDYEKSILFKMNVGRQQAVLSHNGTTCKLKFDPSYRPTAQYAGYLRFNVISTQFEACKALAESLNNSAENVTSIKVSAALLDGKEKGAMTFIYDYGDYHGQLANEKTTCKMN